MTYALKNKAGKFLRGGQFGFTGKAGKLDPMQTMLYTSKREAFAVAEFHGYTVVEIALVEVRTCSR